jgi:hypothetical protein
LRGQDTSRDAGYRPHPAWVKMSDRSSPFTDAILQRTPSRTRGQHGLRRVRGVRGVRGVREAVPVSVEGNLSVPSLTLQRKVDSQQVHTPLCPPICAAENRVRWVSEGANGGMDAA